MPSNAMRKNDRQLSANDPEVFHRVSAMFAIISILIAAAFFYASTIPLEFAVPDYRVRLIRMFAPLPWESGRAFDWIANVLALIPLGFCWSATFVSPAITGPVTGPPPQRAFYRVALGCLALAVLAESLQLWLPLRVPSLRDLVALESGAILGCTLWQILGARTTVACCRVAQRIAAWPGSRLWGLKWMILFGFLLTVCLTINIGASPGQCFQMYRQRAWSADAAGVRDVFDRVTAVLFGTATALALFGLCVLVVRTLEFARVRPERHVHATLQETTTESGVSVADRHVAKQRFADAA